jgi:hypothetical protein
MAYQVFQLNKTGTSLTVTFNPPFAKPPVVIVTPSLIGGSSMDHVETVTAISTTGATIVSGNSGANYFVNVLAIDVDSQSINGVSVIAGSALKNVPSLHIPLVAPPWPSANLLSSFWSGSTSEVGTEDTLSLEDSSSITVVSPNQSSTYYTEYVNIALTDSAGVRSGIVNKLGQTQRVYFTSPWLNPPLVFVSPWWNGSTGGVGQKEFISNIDVNYFDVMSGNSAANFFLSWVAVPTPNAPFLNSGGVYDVAIDDQSVVTHGTLTLSTLPTSGSGFGALAPTGTWVSPTVNRPVEVEVTWDGTRLTWMGNEHVYGPGVWNGTQFAGNFRPRRGGTRKKSNGNWVATKTS